MLKMNKVFTILIFLNSLLLPALAQSQAEVNKHKHVFTNSDNEKKEYKIAKSNSNELQLAFSGLFLFYKNFISSQDGVSCVFTPSCSEYGLMAIKEQGLFKGMANTFDRLTRCHALSADKYEKAPKSQLLIDPL